MVHSCNGAACDRLSKACTIHRVQHLLLRYSAFLEGGSMRSLEQGLCSPQGAASAAAGQCVSWKVTCSRHPTCQQQRTMSKPKIVSIHTGRCHGL